MTDADLAPQPYAALVQRFASSIGAVGTAHLEDLHEVNSTAIDAFTAVIGVGRLQRDRLDALRAAEDEARAIAEHHPDERSLHDALERLRIAWYSTLRLTPADIDPFVDHVEELAISPDSIARVVAWVSRP